MSSGRRSRSPRDIAYFNTATLSPQLRRVRLAGEAALERRGRPWTITSDDWFSDVERLRTLFGGLLGADAEGIALVPATSYGFAVAARNLAFGARRPRARARRGVPVGHLHVARRHPRRRRRDRDRGREPDQTWTDAILDALDERVTVVSVPNVHWTDGAVIDLDVVSARTHEVGARLVIDGSQSIGAMPFDVATLRPDFVMSVGYKWLLGPLGLSYLYVDEEHRHGHPIEENWIARAGSENFARLVDYRDEYQPGARRFDMGQRTSFELVAMAVAALEQLHDWQVPRAGRAVDRGDRRHRRARRPRSGCIRSRTTNAARTSWACTSPTRSWPTCCPVSRRPTASRRSGARPCASLRTSTSPTKTSSDCSTRSPP